MHTPRHRTALQYLAAAGALACTGCGMFSLDPPKSTASRRTTTYRPPVAAVAAKPATTVPFSTPAPRTDINPITLALTGGTQPAASTSTSSLALNAATGVPVVRPGGGGAAFEESASVAQVSFASQGADFDPDVSRDGTHIVFASTQHKTTADLYIKTVDSRVVTQLTSDPSQNVMPKLSPDGQRIAFASDRAGNWDIYVMPAAGGKSIQVTGSAAHELHPSWSPDGQSLVFCRLGEVSGQWELWTTNLSGGGTSTFLGYGLLPEWCPAPGPGDGGADRILFQKSRDRGDHAFAVWTIDLRDGQALNPTEIASSPVAACINPAWSPDGRWVVFATVPIAGSWATSADGRPSSAELWMADLAGTSRVRLTTGPALSLMPDWSATGRLFFVSNRGKTDNIWSMDITPAVKLAMTWRNQAGPSGHTEMVNVPEEK
ncbi:MAG: PD40 domain-containing protein [Phycisphaerales bacterium]|nr:PD40 domain-containing protein [Phycisphaerales bacterium]